MGTDAYAALVTLGWSRAVARRAVDAAIHEQPDAPLEVLIRLALQRCN